MRPAFAGMLAAAVTSTLLGCASADYYSNPGTVPVNDLPDPYRTIAPWGKLPADHPQWGALSAVWVDNDGRSLWVADRCGANSCAGSSWAPVHKLDADGNIVRSFGAGMFLFPHKIYQDRAGDVWVVDMRGGKAVKFTPEGKVLMTLGTPGVRGNPPEALTDPTDVVTDPGNGDIYVAESHTNVEDPNLVGRISVFDRNGKFLRIIGKTGTGPGEFRTPHAVKFDSQGRLVVADRHNHRIQVLTKQGAFVREYFDFGRTSGLAIVRRDIIYTTDSESTERVHPGWQRGIRIGGLADGKVTIFIPPHAAPGSTDGAMGEGIAIDRDGNIYTAEAQLRGVTKYERR